MEGRRRSERLKKSVGLGDGVKQPKDRRTPIPRTRDSVGGVLGLTPHRSGGRNLQVAQGRSGPDPVPGQTAEGCRERGRDREARREAVQGPRG